MVSKALNFWTSPLGPLEEAGEDDMCAVEERVVEKVPVSKEF
jgi:hypothetical protein